MADSDAVRSRRRRAHAAGDHSLCRSGLCVRRPEVVLAAVRAELDRAGCVDTYLGSAALVLAERIDQSTGVTGLSALVRSLQSTMAAVLAGVPRVADPVDELRSRRDRVRAGSV